MPTSSVAQAARSGRPLGAKVLGTAPVHRPAPHVQLDVGGHAVRQGADRGRGSGKPPASKLTVGGDGAPASDAPGTQRANVTPEEKAAQLERELQNLRQQIGLQQEQQQRHTESFAMDASFSSLPDWPPPTPAPRPSTADRQAARAAAGQRVAVNEFEAMVVKKLIARTPLGGPDGAGALKMLVRAFTYYDAALVGSVTSAQFAQVLCKLGCVASLPPSDVMRPLVKGLFEKHARDGELHYRSFAVDVLKAQGVRVPAADAEVEEAKAHANDWIVATSVRQVLARRNLEHSEPHRSRADRTNQMHADLLPRGAWEEPSIAARAADEASYYRVPRIHDVIDNGIYPVAALRGRLHGGKKGREELSHIRDDQLMRQELKRQETEQYAKAARAEVRRAWEDGEAQAKAEWQRHRQQRDALGGMAPGQALAAAARRRAM